MIASQERFLTSLPVNQREAAEALEQLAKDFNGFFALAKGVDLSYQLKYAIALAAGNGFSRMIFDCGIYLPNDRLGMTEFGIDIALTQSQGGAVTLIAGEPLATMLREKGIELGTFKLGTTERSFIHPNAALNEAHRLNWDTNLVTVGYPEGSMFEIRRGEISHDPYPYPVIEINPSPPARWKRFRFAVVVLLIGAISVWLTGSKTIPIIIVAMILYAYYKSMWVRTLILGTCFLSLLYFWME